MDISASSANYFRATLDYFEIKKKGVVCSARCATHTYPGGCPIILADGLCHDHEREEHVPSDQRQCRLVGEMGGAVGGGGRVDRNGELHVFCLLRHRSRESLDNKLALIFQRQFVIQTG